MIIWTLIFKVHIMYYMCFFYCYLKPHNYNNLQFELKTNYMHTKYLKQNYLPKLLYVCQDWNILQFTGIQLIRLRGYGISGVVRILK